MINTIYILVVWIISIVIAWGTIRRAKGEDWYSPITNKHMMIMAVINLAIVVVIPAFFIELFMVSNKAILITNVVFSSLSLIFCVLYFMKGRNKGANQAKPEDLAMRKLIERFFTVFNVVYMVGTVIFAVTLCVVFNKKEEILISSLREFLEPVAVADNTFLISLSLVFWLALSVAFVTMCDWMDNKDANNISEGQPQRVDFFCERVKKRGRKS